MESLFEREENETFSAYSGRALKIEEALVAALHDEMRIQEDKHGAFCIREFCLLAHSAVDLFMNEISMDRRKADESSKNNIDDLEKRVVNLMRGHNLESPEYTLERDAYSGRGMYGKKSPLSVITMERWNLPSTDPGSEVGAALLDMGFAVDSLGLGYVYYLKEVMS